MGVVLGEPLFRRADRNAYFVEVRVGRMRQHIEEPGLGHGCIVRCCKSPLIVPLIAAFVTSRIQQAMNQSTASGHFQLSGYAPAAFRQIYGSYAAVAVLCAEALDDCLSI